MTNPMTKREGIQVISELEAAEKLLSRGFDNKVCDHCKGVGYFMQSRSTGWVCPTCEGAGFLWVKPPPAE